MNIIFTGFMCTGKSETGKIVSKILNRIFFDTDVLIEKKIGLSIIDIFKNFGEDCFRQFEIDIINEISSKDLSVISCGGGIVLNYENIILLRKNGILINLYASPEVIYERSKKEDSRPLLKHKNSLNEIKKIMDFRKKNYSNCDFSFDTDNLTPLEVANKILNNNDVMRALLH
jgi:shikimate kinase